MSMLQRTLKEPRIPELPRILEVTTTQCCKDGIHILKFYLLACRDQLITRNANVPYLANPIAEVCAKMIQARAARGTSGGPF